MTPALNGHTASVGRPDMGDLTREDFERLGRLCAVMVAGEDTSGAVSPLASFFARGQSQVQWSRSWTRVQAAPFVPIGDLQTPISDDQCTALLQVNTASGAPRTWQVRAAARSQTVVVADFYSVAQIRLRIRWTLGAFASVADVDIKAGGCCFPLTADSVQILAYARVADGFINAPPPEIQCAVAPFPLSGDYRAPTLTIYVEVPNPIGLPLVLPIPPHAQRMAVVAPGPLPFSFLDSATQTLGVYQQAQGFNLTQDIPGGASFISILGPPSPFSLNPCALIFQLGL